MTENEKAYRNECNCDEIQKLWKPDTKWIEENPEETIWLPSLSQIIAVIGDNFGKIVRGEDRNGEEFFVCYLQVRNGDGEPNGYTSGYVDRIEGATPERAAIKALKQVLKGER